MADTTFVNGTTLTDEDWFNDLNRLHYTIFGDPADDAAARTGIGAAASGANTDITSLAGTATNDSAAAGKIGEYISSAVGATAAPATTTYGDLTSINLTAGDWDVSAQAALALGTATFSGYCFSGIGTVTGNDATGLVAGDTRIEIFPPGSASSSGGSVTSRVSLAAPATIYLKMMATFSAGSPNFYGRISARRVR